MKKSAGIVLYRTRNQELEVLLVHPGGPFWQHKDKGAWSIPKGETEPGEIPLEVAKREFQEETGFPLDGDFLPLTPVRQKGGKIVEAWMVKGDIDAGAIVSNSFEIEWPYKSGRKKTFPEIDKAEWFTISQAMEKINIAQVGFLQELHKNWHKMA